MNQQPIWYKLISSLKATDTIKNGLTIPYILGAKEIVDSNFKITNDSILSLLTEISNSDLELKSLLQFCGIGEYVIGLELEANCKSNFVDYLAFCNESGQKSLFVHSSAKRLLGDTIEKISNSLLKRYQECIEMKRFSWNGKWESFSAYEVSQIKSIFDDSKKQ